MLGSKHEDENWRLEQELGFQMDRVTLVKGRRRNRGMSQRNQKTSRDSARPETPRYI